MFSSKKMATALLSAALIPSVFGFASISAAHEPSTADIQLAVKLTRDDKETVRVLFCNDNPNEFHPNGEKACKQLMALHAADKDPFAPVSPEYICLPVAEPGVAEVKGTFLGSDVKTIFTRSNSCQQERWNFVSELLEIDY